MKMLRKQGTDKVFPYTDILATRRDMVVFDVPDTPQKSTVIELKAPLTNRPGPGWVLNHLGRWKRKNVF